MGPAGLRSRRLMIWHLKGCGQRQEQLPSPFFDSIHFMEECNVQISVVLMQSSLTTSAMDKHSFQCFKAVFPDACLLLQVIHVSFDFKIRYKCGSSFRYRQRQCVNFEVHTSSQSCAGV